MRSVTIRMKIVGLVALFACGLATVLAMVYSKTSEKLEGSDYRDVVAMKDLIADVLPPPLYAIEALTVALQATQAMDKSSVAETRARWKQLEADFAARQRYWTEQQLHGPLRLSLLDNASPIGRKVFDIGNEQLLPAIAADDRVKAQAALVAITQAYNQHRAHIDEVVKQANQQVDVSIVAASSAIVTRKVEFMAVGLLVLLAGGFVAFLVVRDVAHRMQTTSDLLDRVSKGDLTQRVSVDSTDEIGRMAASLNNTLDAIENALAEVQQVSETVAEAADRLSGQSEQISTGAQQQASSLEETAASLEQITATVKQSSGSAQQASQLAMSSREVAQNGGLVVQEAVGAMTEITRASQRIGDIITTIDEIALQTNLLALNAAVEAARAGEQGRGFAVVASEVGSLAQRSAGAAKEVKTLIQDTLGRVNTGQKLVDQSGRTLQDIIVSVKKVTDIVGDIAAAAREQSAGVEQVNQAVSQMDQVTQSNAGQTEELARTADGLSQNAAQLRALVSNFRLGAGGRKDARPSRPAPRNDARRPSARPAARNGARRGARAETASERRGPAFDAGSDEWELAGSSGASSHDRQAEPGDQGSDDKHFESV